MRTASHVVRPERIHRGVVICNIDDILPDGWSDWMDIPSWPETFEETPVCGLGPKRWRMLADYAVTLQEREVALALGDYSTVAQIAVTMHLSRKRIEQIARGLLNRLANPQKRQIDMFEDGGEG